MPAALGRAFVLYDEVGAATDLRRLQPARGPTASAAGPHVMRKLQVRTRHEIAREMPRPGMTRWS
jgi:hypothetical protein